MSAALGKPSGGDALDRFQDEVQAAEEVHVVDQSRAPILEGIQAYYDSDVAQFTIPTHKSGAGVDGMTLDVLGPGPFLADAPMQFGIDDRVAARQVLTHAESLAAELFGGDRCLFSTSGTTLSVQVALLATVRPGEKVAISRNVHKSAVTGLVLSGAEPVWIDPVIDDDNAIAHAVTPDAVAAALEAHPDIVAALVVSPTPWGVAADVAAIAEICHARSIPLVVDEAWGLLFGFHPDLPPGAANVGADLVVGSLHKSLTGVMQTSFIVTRGDLVDDARLDLAMDAMETTSASVVMLATMDGARRTLALRGHDVIERTLRLSRSARERIADLGVAVFEPVVGSPGVAGFDPTKVSIDVRALGISGFETADWLYGEHRLGVELVDHRHVSFLVSPADDDTSVDRLVDTVGALVEHTRGRDPLPHVGTASDLLAGAEYALSPRDAYFAATMDVPLQDAVGRLAAEPVSPYPPGVPALVPGQRITQAIVDFLSAGLRERMLIKGASDPSLSTVRTVAEGAG